MVGLGLSVVLEEVEEHHHQQQQGEHIVAPEIISKTNMSMVINNPGTGTGTGSSSSNSSSPSPSPSSSSAFLRTLPVADFLHHCFLCRDKLSPGKDIYMYRGDRGFCSEECRCRQILLDEEEAFRSENQTQSHCSSAAPAHPSSSRNRRGNRNRASGGM